MSLKQFTESNLMTQTSKEPSSPFPTAPTRQFLENLFYDTLNTLFDTIVKVRELAPEVAEELRRLVLRPNDILIRVEGEES